ncbi:hypothetical protein BC937DRAFT_94348 [Endogone sp. FLAS-F59071]|nr:hypothetical protein BC937DRAFT_94348 [Endogone sp. FLAS-F59071]|eukprot:RUS14094.1 hypothetical protein BC937DRAFT_94348 [Endogone sp. FLAS-F59071]
MIRCLEDEMRQLKDRVDILSERMRKIGLRSLVTDARAMYSNQELRRQGFSEDAIFLLRSPRAVADGGCARVPHRRRCPVGVVITG